MPVFVGWIGSMLATYVGELAIRALIGVGVGLTANHFVVGPARALIQSRLAGAGDLAQYVGWLGIDTAITIVLSAWVGRLAANSAKAFFVKKAAH